MSVDKQPSIGVIGGGISGLASAFYLEREGGRVTVYERASIPGGVIGSVRKGEWLVELGPNTLLARTAGLWELIEALGLESDVLEAGREAKKRFVVKDGRPVPLPTSLLSFLSTELFSARAKLRLLMEPFVGRGTGNESVAAFFGRRLGREVVDYAVNPFVGGIFAGDPKRLSMAYAFSSVYKLEQDHGSLLRGMMKRVRNNMVRKRLISFRNGISQLTDALASKLEGTVRYGSPVTHISGSAGNWKLAIEGMEMPAEHDALIVTTPLHQLPSIASGIERAETIEELAHMPYAPVAVVAMGFRKEQIRHPLEGFGMLVPELEPYSMLGALFSSSLFPGRAPEGHHLLTCFVGGARNPELAVLAEDELLELVVRDLRFLMGCSGDPVFHHIHRWKRAIPQYGADHGRYLKQMEQLEQANPGLFLTGNFRNEVSLPGCIEQARETAGRTAAFLES